MPMPTGPSIPRAALVLGWLGVIPFAAFSGLSLADTIISPIIPQSAATSGLIFYAAIILSFMGGAQWGLAMNAPANDQAAFAKRLAISVLPALAGFAFAVFPARVALPGLAAAFLALLVYDIASARHGAAPAWYPALRAQLTAAVVTCLVIAALFGSP